MFGKAIAESPQRRGEAPVGEGNLFLELRGVSTQPEGTGLGLKEINLTVRSGEIVGIAGVSGNGQRELGDVVLGMETCSRGSKYMGGEDATHWSVARVRESGAAFIPEDPLGMAAFPWLSVQENMAMANTSLYARQGGLSMDWESVRSDLQGLPQTVGVQYPARLCSAGHSLRRKYPANDSGPGDGSQSPVDYCLLPHPGPRCAKRCYRTGGVPGLP